MFYCCVSLARVTWMIVSLLVQMKKKLFQWTLSSCMIPLHIVAQLIHLCALNISKAKVQQPIRFQFTQVWLLKEEFWLVSMSCCPSWINIQYNLSDLFTKVYNKLAILLNSFRFPYCSLPNYLCCFFNSWLLGWARWRASSAPWVHTHLKNPL